VDISSIQRLWPDVVEAVKQRSRAAWMVIVSGVQPVALDGKVLTLGFDAEGHRLGFVNGGRDAVVREVLKERMGVEWRIDTVVGGGSGGGGGGARPDTGRPPGGAPSSGFGSSQPSGGFGSGSSPQPPQASPPPAPAEPPAPRPEPKEAPPPSPPPVDESDEVDPESDEDADDTAAETSGMALLERELGGQIIKEFDSSAP
jgi:DNA polymerase-3 subunit gamma/tau